MNNFKIEFRETVDGAVLCLEMSDIEVCANTTIKAKKENVDTQQLKKIYTSFVYNMLTALATLARTFEAYAKLCKEQGICEAPNIDIE
jgi:2-methylisocitrate lyase-like PEP mutase family enzyme